MVLHDLDPRLQVGRGGAARAHGHEILRDVLGLDVADIDQPQQLLEVRRHPERSVEHAILLVHLPPAVE